MATWLTRMMPTSYLVPRGAGDRGIEQVASLYWWHGSCSEWRQCRDEPPLRSEKGAGGIGRVDTERSEKILNFPEARCPGHWRTSATTNRNGTRAAPGRSITSTRTRPHVVPSARCR